MKDIIKQHGIIILCAISIAVLLLPLATVVASIDVMGTTTNSEVSVTGFSALGESIFGYFLIIGPAVLIAMNYVKALGKYKGILAIAVPIVCLIALVIVVIQAKSAGNVNASNEYASAEVSLSVGIGAILAGLCYIATAIVGAITYHDFNLEKAGLGKLKESGSELLNSMQEKFSQGAQTVSGGEESAAPATEVKKSVAKKSENLNCIDEILALIEKLSKMKDSGILTEEEFSEKKKQLLGEI